MCIPCARRSATGSTSHCRNSDIHWLAVFASISASASNYVKEPPWTERLSRACTPPAPERITRKNGIETFYPIPAADRHHRALQPSSSGPSMLSWGLLEWIQSFGFLSRENFPCPRPRPSNTVYLPNYLMSGFKFPCEAGNHVRSECALLSQTEKIPGTDKHCQI